MIMGKKTSKRGEGCLYQDKNGYYVYRFYYTDIDNKIKRRAFGGSDPDELRMRADEFLRDIEDMRNGVESMAPRNTAFMVLIPASIPKPYPTSITPPILTAADTMAVLPISDSL